eukprot:gnl/MRDRNA2_/MRDRNA2_129444_c0_seq1.p1 gnl/MRDRNA2_/MRDRNA2_129444_c0~~gnl/MRDRNA2_/MRDRNA2_129444_c0_seq1.p1  ORF type:complete len:800 (-),score=198.46 gnl/MRDRNA2_/MRDRNA2_129444_c0_seq1:23-2422(-)
MEADDLLLTAWDLSARLGCSVQLVEAALDHVEDRDLGKAERLLIDGPKEAYDRLGEGAKQIHGDSVFRHPFVQCLLDVARQRVLQVLEDQPAPEEDRWLICVRTYGRAGIRSQQSELFRFLNGLLNPKDAERIEKDLISSGINDLATLKRSLKKKAFGVNKALVKAGFKKLKEGVICKMEEGVKKPLENIEKKLLKKEKGLLELTLRALELALGPKGYQRCLIFVAHSDNAFTSGAYAAALKGTVWADRIIVGVKGADLQVRFIEEASPKGTHIVVMDDNIEELVVEECNDKQVAKNLVEKRLNEKRRVLTSDQFQDPLLGTGLKIMEESSLRQFLRGAGFKMIELTSIEEMLRKVSISTLPELLGILGEKPAESLNKEALNVALKEASLDLLPHRHLRALRGQTERPLPPPQLLAKSTAEKSVFIRTGESELAQLIGRAGQDMVAHKVNLWGVCPSQNHYFLRCNGDAIREKAKKKGIYMDYSKSLGLVYGAFFGFKALHDHRRFTRFGQVKDDVERTLRYWHLDGAVLRFMRYGVEKSFKPGKFHATKGGISANSSEDLHTAEAMEALQGILDEFARPYVRFPKPGERSSCGLVWHAPKRDQSDVCNPEQKENSLGEQSNGADGNCKADDKNEVLSKLEGACPEVEQGAGVGKTGPSRRPLLQKKQKNKKKEQTLERTSQKRPAESESDSLHAKVPKKVKLTQEELKTVRANNAKKAREAKDKNRQEVAAIPQPVHDENTFIDQIVQARSEQLQKEKDSSSVPRGANQLDKAVDWLTQNNGKAGSPAEPQGAQGHKS